MTATLPSTLPPVAAPAPLQTVDQQLSYVPQGQYTPPASASCTPLNTSPTSPRISWNLPPHLQPRVTQIRPPKSPMYVPAVLRPTEKPARHSPPKHSQPTKYGSPESLVDASSQAQTSTGPVPGVARIVTEEWNEEALGAVTGRPSRDHWKVRQTFPASRSHFFHYHSRRIGRVFFP